jgi:predicted DsbA family dithiol-disulfide isomerase
MHDKLFANQRELSRPDLTKHATALGLNAGTFDQCLDSGKATARIRKDITDAEKLQANGTPTFFIGLTEANPNQIKGTRLVGALPYASFKEAIDRLLAAPPQK